MVDDNTETQRSGVGRLVEYGIEDRPDNGKAVALGTQHLLAMFLSTVALPLVIASAIGLGSADITFLVQMALLVAGVATLVQVYPIGPIGARLPIVMGTSAIFVSPLIDIGSTFGLAAIFGAVIIAAPIEVIIGYFFDDVEKFFPPLVTGIVVMLVGLTLVPIAIQYSAGVPGTDACGSLENLGLAALVLDNTIPGTREERGLAEWDDIAEDEGAFQPVWYQWFGFGDDSVASDDAEAGGDRR
jgi:xanthine/uracil permease